MRFRWALALLTLGAVSALGVGLYLHRHANPGCDPNAPGSCKRVFFAGNSYTAVNDLPTMFADLAWSGGHRVETGVEAPGGWTLADHDKSVELDKMLSSTQWNLVVLQEQSEIPSVEGFRQATMYPAARDLVGTIRHDGARPMFFITWAHRNGWPLNGLRDYPSMQSSIDAGYLTIAREENAAVAPVGFAWRAMVEAASDPGLWQDDGSHPTTKGTYLAACVFYASIFLESPAGLTFHADLSDADASQAQLVASGTVLGDPSKWGLP
jgi:hypothetical protein